MAVDYTTQKAASGIPTSAQSTSTSTGTASIPRSENVLSLTSMEVLYQINKSRNGTQRNDGTALLLFHQCDFLVGQTV